MPLFAATLVGCLLQDDIRVVHVVLMSTGLGLMYLGHRLDYHPGVHADGARDRTPDEHVTEHP
ncbi:MAG: hypothetical protein GY715_11930 [Planctomycetes bacterium]|nr:hypothetical protein [Planctomycetota bacterium]